MESGNALFVDGTIRRQIHPFDRLPRGLFQPLQQATLALAFAFLGAVIVGTAFQLSGYGLG